MFERIEHGAVCEIRMAHPPVNALGPQFTATLTRALQSEAETSRAIVLSGQPGMFSAGLDLVALMALDREGIAKYWGQFFGLLDAIGSSPVPVASAITGHSPAGGAVMAIHGDYRVMTRGEFKIGLNEVQVGLVVPPQIQRALIRLVGRYRAERLLVAGAMLDPESALRFGFVDELADDFDTTVGKAVEWCQAHCALPPNAMRRTRELIRADIASNYEDVSDADLEAFSEVWFSEETQRTLGAILERLKGKTG